MPKLRLPTDNAACDAPSVLAKVYIVLHEILFGSQWLGADLKN